MTDLKVDKKRCRKEQGLAEEGNSCLQTPGTCESCPNWWKRAIPGRIKRNVSATKDGGPYCMSCGKNKSKRKGKFPAPIRLVAGVIDSWLCMTCAKQISNRLDVVIAAIEGRYGKV